MLVTTRRARAPQSLLPVVKAPVLVGGVLLIPIVALLTLPFLLVRAAVRVVRRVRGGDLPAMDPAELESLRTRARERDAHPEAPEGGEAARDALRALQTLGYRTQEAREAVAIASADAPNLPASDLTRAALRSLKRS